MEVKITIPQQVAAALLRFQIDKGFSTPAGAAAYLLTHALCDRGLF